MRHMLCSLLCAAVLVVVGCKSDNGTNTDAIRETKTSSSGGGARADACPKCPGVQTATADGKCPACKTSVNAAGGTDVCSHCAGVQTASADATCPGCNMRVRKS